MSEPTSTVQEYMTTAADGDTTVNERLSPGGPGPEGQADTATERLSGQPDTTDEAPAHSALKADWVEHAVSRGADRDTAETMTKQELIDEYGN